MQSFVTTHMSDLLSTDFPLKIITQHINKPIGGMNHQWVLQQL